MENIQTIFIIMSGMLAFIIFWSFVVWFIARVGGWSSLADAYPSRLPFNETCWSLQRARFRWGVGYNGVLRVCADAQALHLSVLSLFRPGHPPLSIPWEDITGSRRVFWIELRFRRTNSVFMRISPGLAEKLEQAAAGMWHYEKE